MSYTYILPFNLHASFFLHKWIMTTKSLVRGYLDLKKARTSTSSGYKRCILNTGLLSEYEWKTIDIHSISPWLMNYNTIYVIKKSDMDIHHYIDELQIVFEKFKPHYKRYTESKYSFKSKGKEYILRQSRCNGAFTCSQCGGRIGSRKKTCADLNCVGRFERKTCPISMFILYFNKEEDPCRYPEELVFILMVPDDVVKGHNHAIWE